MFTRYAIYVVPDGPWGDFGAAWLGWDTRSGEDHASPHPELTARPRKYGFHGTIKAPFRLLPGQTAEGLAAAARALSGKFQPFSLNSLQLSRLGPFFAMTAPGEQAQLRGVADTMLVEMEPFRAPLTPEDLARRRAAKLSAQQDAYLVQYGYPHVLDAFKFHLTLTGPAKDPERAEQVIRNALPAHAGALMIDSLCLCGEAQDGRFHVIERMPFAGL